MSHALHPDDIQTDISCAELVCVDGQHGQYAQLQNIHSNCDAAIMQV